MVTRSMVTEVVLLWLTCAQFDGCHQQTGCSEEPLSSVYVGELACGSHLHSSAQKSSSASLNHTWKHTTDTNITCAYIPYVDDLDRGVQLSCPHIVSLPSLVLAD